MKPRELIIIIGVFCLIWTVSCAQKDVGEAEPVVQEVSQANNKEETVPAEVVKEDTPESLDAPDNRTVIDQITSKTPEDEEDTAVTYPRPVKIKKYKPISNKDSWFLVGGVTGERAYSIFVDPESIETRGELISSWSKLKFVETQYDDDGLPYKEVQINSSVDCEAKTYSYTDSRFYDAIGRLVDNQIVPYEPKPVIEGTVSAKIADFVCGYQHNHPE